MTDFQAFLKFVNDNGFGCFMFGAICVWAMRDAFIALKGQPYDDELDDADDAE